jgi:hypothetical protein
VDENTEEKDRKKVERRRIRKGGRKGRMEDEQ